MQIIFRRDARIAGLTKYFTGQPCQNGHVCQRYTNTAHCVECDKIDRAKYRERIRNQKLVTVLSPTPVPTKPKLKSVIEPKKQLAKPIPAPDWSSIGHSVESIQQRARQYRDEYIGKKNTR